MSESPNPVATASAALVAAEAALADLQSAAAPATPSAALDAWLGGLNNSAVSRDTESWNRVHGLVQQIKAVLAQVKE